MNWKEEVAQLEREGSFDIAIFVLEKEIKEHPNNMDAYIFLLYRFMDLYIRGSAQKNKVRVLQCKKMAVCSIGAKVL
jgi:hypothetical protein